MNLFKLILSRSYPAALLAWLVASSVYMLIRTLAVSTMTLEVMAYTDQSAAKRFFGADMTHIEASLIFPITIALATFLFFRYIDEDNTFLARAVKENSAIANVFYGFIVLGIIANCIVISWLSISFIQKIIEFSNPNLGGTDPEENRRIFVFIGLYVSLLIPTFYLLLKGFFLRRDVVEAQIER